MRKNNYLCSRIPLLKRDVAQKKANKKNKIFNKKNKNNLKTVIQIFSMFQTVRSSEVACNR